jgi:hypothetical protein
VICTEIHCRAVTLLLETCRTYAVLFRNPLEAMVSRTLLLIILVIVLLAVLPTWPYSSGWGYYPSGGLGLIVIVVLILLLMDRRV